MANETLIEQIFGAHYPETRIAALHTALTVARENGVEPFPAKPGASAKDVKAVQKAAEKIAAAFDKGAPLNAGDVATVYLGEAVPSTGLSPNAALLVHRFTLAINEYNGQQVAA